MVDDPRRCGCGAGRSMLNMARVSSTPAEAVLTTLRGSSSLHGIVEPVQAVAEVTDEDLAFLIVRDGHDRLHLGMARRSAEQWRTLGTGSGNAVWCNTEFD